MASLAEVVKSFIQGDVVVIPTESSYCYIADPFNNKAIAELLKLYSEQKQNSKPAILIGDLSELASIVQNIDSSVEEKVINNWPGEVSLLFKPLDFIDRALLYDNKNIAIRLPEEPYVLEILHALGQPAACIHIYDGENLAYKTSDLRSINKEKLEISNYLHRELPTVI
jgi:L-threonylcarbamoyladenylate synthase